MKSEISYADLSEVIFGRSKGISVILAVYADDSSDKGRERLFTVGGFVGFPAGFFEAERHWEACLKRNGLEYFKASECQGLIGQFDPSRLMMEPNACHTFAENVRHELGKIIIASGICGVALSLDMVAFREIIKANPQSVEYFQGSDPYIYLFMRYMIDAVALFERELPEFSGVPLAFILDEHSKWKSAEAAYQNLRKNNPALGKRLGHIGHSDDIKTLPLQMADLCAYEARHQTLATLDGKPFRKEFTRMVGSGAFAYFATLNKQTLLEELVLAKEDDEKRRIEIDRT